MFETNASDGVEIISVEEESTTEWSLEDQIDTFPKNAASRWKPDRNDRQGEDTEERSFSPNLNGQDCNLAER